MGAPPLIERKIFASLLPDAELKKGTCTGVQGSCSRAHCPLPPFTFTRGCNQDMYGHMATPCQFLEMGAKNPNHHGMGSLVKPHDQDGASCPAEP